MADNIVWDDEAGIVWDDQPKAKAAAPAAPYQPYQGIDPASDTERFGENPGTGAGGAEFHQGIASTPARLVKSIAQLTGLGKYVPEVVNQSAQVADTGFGTAGRVVGDIAATALPASKVAQATAGMSLRAKVAAVMAENAGYGAALSPDEQGSAAATGAVAGPLGMALGRTVGGLVKPTAEARTLMDRGVALTPGQAAGTGSFMNRAEQWMGSNPISGSPIRAAQRRAVEDANVAAAQSVANIVDSKVKLGLPPREAIEQTRELVGKTFDESLEGMKLPLKMVKDDLTTMLPDFVNDHPMITQDHLNRLSRYVNVRLGDLSKNGMTTLDGQMLKHLDTELGEQIRSLKKSSTAAERDAAFAWSDLQQELRGLMEKGAASPEQFKKLTDSNSAYRQLLALEKAMLAGNETFTPRRLSASLEKMGIKNSDLNTVAKAMNKTIPNSVPDSGTAERLLANGLPALLLGGGYGAQNMGLDTLGTGMMAAGALGSRPGAKFMTGGYGGQPFMEAAARHLRRGVVPATRGKKDE